MKPQKIGLYILMLALSINSFGQVSERDSGKEGLMVRLAEIEIDSIYVDEYLVILKEESEASVRLEPGVICI